MSSGRRHVVLCVHGSPSCYSSLHQCHPPAPCSPTGPSRTRSIRMPACLRNLLHRPGRYGLVGGEELIDAERDQLLELCRQRLDAFRMQRGEEVGCCLANPAPTGPRGGPHRAKEPGRLGRPQQPAGPLLPLQCRQARCSLPMQEGAPTSSVCRPATATAKWAVCSARWRAAAGCCWRTHWKLCIADAYPVSEGAQLSR